ncbi:protein madd-4 isoform X2 [Onthophagus taurus]|uniref:protein madd-4 isoform X2 n=1 Tax=Onthophagus taurus TaxID=166361 RepID=UPI000C1FF49B|nr:ADAMTS-like protein 1 isoform X2 [Onthophagus taurus]
MQFGVISFLMFLSFLTSPSSSALDDNYTLPEIQQDLTITAEDDSEQELSSQLHDVDSRGAGGGWSAWSEWSPCSRSCDGGVAHQLRRCQKGGCRGDRVRYKICNMQPCPEARDFREDQCAAFNGQLYEGISYTWFAHYDDLNPCVLACKGRSFSEENDQSDDVVVVARLGEKVHDGTRCRPGSLDMCIDGKCQRVGCDLRIGSTLQVDACGVCGGDGSSCSRPLYHWTLASMSLCSATCGVGYKMSRPVCQNVVTGEEVEEQLCNESQRPDNTVIECNMHTCPPKWHAGDWGPCSASCGGGSKLRQVHCTEETNSTKIKIEDEKCSGYKPRYQESCNQMDCPKWHSSSWSGCSVSCGEGMQVRVVECRDHNDQPSVLCPSHLKPTTTKPCATGIQCPYSVDEHSEELMPGLYHTQPLIQPYPPSGPAIAERLIGEPVVPSESTFIADEWGPCSVTCGEGIRKRQVHCKIFLEFSRTIAKLPDNKCSGEKPAETGSCFLEPCSSERLDIKDDPYRQDTNQNIKVGGGSPRSTYSWREQGYTHCSATCLGGVQELIVNCVRDDTQKVTSPYLCPRETKPEILIRTCNDYPCPPRWNYSDFSQCTQSCGIGIQTREVNCIHEVTQGGGNTVVVPNNMCPQPPPPDRQYCNVLDCPVKWIVTEWSKCSRACGTGEKTRKVECKQVMAQNHTVDRPISMCPSPRPSEKKPCNTKSCVLESDKPHIDVSNSTYIQHSVKKKKVFLKIGGAATVFYGTVVKIKCPVKRFNRTKIAWTKNGRMLPKTKKFRVSKKGALRIQNVAYADKGTYTCAAGKSAANLTLTVRAKPGEFMNSEEISKQKSDTIYDSPDIQPRRDDDRVNPMLNNDDHSHEQRPDNIKKPKSKVFTPTSPSLKADSNSLSGWAAGSTVDSKRDQSKLSASQLPSSSDSLRPEGSTSSASRALPYFQQLISNLQAYSRGHRTISFPEELINTKDSAPIILGRGPPENLKFDWVMTEWSKCSESCGDGFQTRQIHCLVRLHNNTQRVDDNMCEDAGLELPVTVRKCGIEECPKWVVDEWSTCSKSKCYALHTALQRRGVKCHLYNTSVAAVKCKDFEKPVDLQECENVKCIGKWKMGSWSKCNAPCGAEGVKYRILQCVWYGTKKPAGTACRDLHRPPVTKSCKGPPCLEESLCTDKSMFCSNVRMMNLCTSSTYKTTCCKSCASVE